MVELNHLEVVGSENMQQTFKAVTDLLHLAKSNTFPCNKEEALDWVRNSPDTESRSARKHLSLGLRYGVDAQSFKDYIKK